MFVGILVCFFISIAILVPFYYEASPTESASTQAEGNDGDLAWICLCLAAEDLKFSSHISVTARCSLPNARPSDEDDNSRWRRCRYFILHHAFRAYDGGVCWICLVRASSEPESVSKPVISVGRSVVRAIVADERVVPTEARDVTAEVKGSDAEGKAPEAKRLVEEAHSYPKTCGRSPFLS
ncbi:hypothetical protein Nepgr_031016 [Nepenthes gracilis]|uniref:Uncharacterized protein n=1 Tax=Nepenthes gracilis TaxID=150966 RepID=A0AAD3Y4S3_NEPGR|nr:hypothetical protein Nepgr_031016 [Nepenthes gracilis]